MIYIWVDEDDRFVASWQPPTPETEYIRLEYEDERPAIFKGDSDDEIGVVS